MQSIPVASASPTNVFSFRLEAFQRIVKMLAAASDADFAAGTQAIFTSREITDAVAKWTAAYSAP